MPFLKKLSTFRKLTDQCSPISWHEFLQLNKSWSYRFPLKKMIIVGFIHQMNGATKVKQMQKLIKSEAKSHSV